ncbi:MAG: hypothetical protein VB959_04010 [Rhodospirillales bacterium]
MLASGNWTHSLRVALIAGGVMQFLAAPAGGAETRHSPNLTKSIFNQQKIDAAYAAGCPTLPRVAWWNTSHWKIVKFIDERYNGAWDSYIERWVNYQRKMQRILDEDGTAVVRSRGLHLKGPVLAAHISDIERRIRVTECLKTRFGGRLAAASAAPGAATATGGAGGDDLGQRPKAHTLISVRSAAKIYNRRVIVSAIEDAMLNVEIVARCDKRTPVFQVTNLGDKWPRTGTIGIYRKDGRTKLSERRVRLANSQQMTFMARQVGKSAAGEVGLWLNPAWSKRGFAYDSKINCSTS